MTITRMISSVALIVLSVATLSGQVVPNSVSAVIPFDGTSVAGVRLVSMATGAACTDRINNAIGSSAGRILVDESCTTTAAIALDQADQIFECLPEITLTKGFNGNLLELTAARITVRGCHLDANKAGPWTGSNIVFSGVGGSDSSIVEFSRILNAEFNGLNIGRSSNVFIRHNVITGSDKNGVFVSDDSLEALVHDNVISSGTDGSTDAVAFISAVAGKTVSGVVSNNTLEANNGFCVEVGAFGGDAPTEVIVEGNHCTAVAGFEGGYSFSNVVSGTITGNTLDTNGQTGSIAGIEVVTSTGISVTGNVINGGTTLSQGILIGQVSNIVIDGNIVNGWTTSSLKAGIFIGSSISGNCRENIVSNNLIIAPSTVDLLGIRIQANHASADCSRNLITGNLVIMNGVAGSQGINIAGGGTIADNAIIGNSIENAAVGMFDAGVNTRIIGNQITNTTLNYTGGSTTPYIQDMTFTHANLPAAADGSVVECTDCVKRSDPCASGGSDSQAARVNGAWVCGGGNTYFDSVNVASTATMTLPAGNLFHITGTNDITTMNTCDAANNGRLVNLIFDAVLTFTDGNNLKLAGDFVTTADDAIQLICDGTNWYQTSPGSVN